MSNAKILAWDLELTPMTVYSWSLWPNSIPIQQIVKPQEILSFSARWVGSKKNIFRSTHHDGAEAMLDELWSLLDESDALISWNGQGFDTKHAMRQFLEAGKTPPAPSKEIDLMRTAKRRFKLPSNKLDYVAKLLGVGSKTTHTGFQLWIDCMAGDDKAWNLMRKYNKQDVDLLIELYEKLLPWIDNHPMLASHGFTCRCGSTNIQRRGFHTTKASKFPKYVCKDCGAWGHDRRRVETTSDIYPL